MEKPTSKIYKIDSNYRLHITLDLMNNADSCKLSTHEVTLISMNLNSIIELCTDENNVLEEIIWNNDGLARIGLKLNEEQKRLVLNIIKKKFIKG